MNIIPKLNVLVFLANSERIHGLMIQMGIRDPIFVKAWGVVLSTVKTKKHLYESSASLEGVLDKMLDRLEEDDNLILPRQIEEELISQGEQVTILIEKISSWVKQLKHGSFGFYYNPAFSTYAATWTISINSFTKHKRYDIQKESSTLYEACHEVWQKLLQIRILPEDLDDAYINENGGNSSVDG